VQVPKNTPEPVVERINAAMSAVMQNADVRKGIEGTGGNVTQPMNAAALDKVYTSEVERYRASPRGSICSRSDGLASRLLTAATS
jgi:tripartite-type tricarboxylate transporter receptor subunit TctC